MTLSPSLSCRAVPLLPLALLVWIVLIDSVQWPTSVPVIAALDWSGHLATSLVLVLACVGGNGLRRDVRGCRIVLVASVLIDVDHVSLFLGAHWVAPGGGRPVTHGPITLLGLALAALVLRRHRNDLCAAGVGVILHFFRDIATGPGLLLLWPFSARQVLLSHRGYLIVLGALAALAARRMAAENRRAGARGKESQM